MSFTQSLRFLKRGTPWPGTGKPTLRLGRLMSVRRTTIERTSPMLRSGSRVAASIVGALHRGGGSIGRVSRLGARARGHKFFGNQYVRLSLQQLGFSRKGARKLNQTLRYRKQQSRQIFGTIFRKATVSKSLINMKES